MRVFAISDLHVDYEPNASWVQDLSTSDHVDDVLILAGDVSDSLQRLDRCFSLLSSRFSRVFFVPGNHDLWVIRDAAQFDSLSKFSQVCNVAAQNGVSLQGARIGRLSIVPLLGWYDYSFGAPGEELTRSWMDFRACRWPDGMQAADIANHFLAMNTKVQQQAADDVIISFSHFLPRIDLMPDFIPPQHRTLYPVLGTTQLETHVRRLNPAIHVYGHSHVNRSVHLDGITYINNALAYPHENHIASRELLCVYDEGAAVHAPPRAVHRGSR